MYEKFWDKTNAHFLLKYDKKEAELIINDLLSDISQYDNVLEYGCGAGRFIDYLRRLYPDTSFTGVDFSQKMCTRFTRRFKRFKNISIFKNNGKDLSDFDDNTFDLIYSIVVLQHVPNLDLIGSILTEIYRVSNGKILIQFSDKKPHYIESDGTTLHGYRMPQTFLKEFVKDDINLKNFKVHQSEFMKERYWFLLEINKCI